MSHDASATWSGFNYQGKVALYHTLTLLKRKLEEDENYDFSGYELILENNEDFDIKGPDGFVSFHQVKAINKTAFGTYENALLAMMLQLDKPEYSSVIGYLHTWKALRWNDSLSFNEKLRGILRKVVDDYLEDSQCSFIFQALSGDVVSEKKIKIIRKAIAEDTRMSDEDSTFTVVNDAYSATGDESVSSRIRRYSYDGELACDIESIDSKVKEAIVDLCAIFGLESDEEVVDRIFCALLAMLDKNIILKHGQLNTEEESAICFADVLDAVVDDKIRDSDEGYLASSFKLKFVKAFEEFISDEELCSQDIASAYMDGESNLNVAMNVLLSLSPAALWSHFVKLNPHVSFSGEKVIDKALTVNLDNLRQYLFSIFRDMCSTKFNHNVDDNLVLYQNGKKKYLPTTIGMQTKKNLVINIMENSQAISSLFEVTAMLTGCEHAKEIECFAEEYSRLTEVSLGEIHMDALPEEKEKFMQISRDLRLVKVNTAIEEMIDA